MHSSEIAGTSVPQDDTLPADPAALAALVRERLSRRMIVAVLAPPEGPTNDLLALADALATFPGARVAYEQVLTDLETFLTRLHSLGPDVVLVGAVEASAPAPVEHPWHQRVFTIADRIGLCDRSFVALVGPYVTRPSARTAGFEDGFPLDTPIDKLLPALAREALARDEFRRQGSSPPCYLR
ncbi:MAG TPA: hypothetical protein VKQ30_19225 [Ktedonobacterales bacterium]|nr:hypothetical protein [Ktedonobacterales bacterium]